MTNDASLGVNVNVDWELVKRDEEGRIFQIVTGGDNKPTVQSFYDVNTGRKFPMETTAPTMSQADAVKRYSEAVEDLHRETRPDSADLAIAAADGMLDH